MSARSDRQHFEPAGHGEVVRLRRSLIRLQDEARLLRRDVLKRKYNPSQPRVPAGGPGGGQWTSGAGGGGSGGAMPGFGEEGGLAEFAPEDGFVVDDTGDEAWAFYEESTAQDGTVSERAVVNRDGSTIHSEYAASREAGFDERHTVTTPKGDKVIFETTDQAQTIRLGNSNGEIVSRSVWAPDGPTLEPTIQPAFAPIVVAPALVIGGAILFNWQSPFNGSDGQQAVMGFNAREFRPSGSGALDLDFSGRVTQEEAVAACKYLPEMQARLDDVVAGAGVVRDYPSAAAYGSYVHKQLKDQIDQARYPDLYAERSFLKELNELQRERVRYGAGGSIRIDAIEYRPDGTVCVYDFKTGSAGVGASRAYVLGRAGYFSALARSRAIVIEVRPNRR